jgi:hypothetical protein
MSAARQRHRAFLDRLPAAPTAASAAAGLAGLQLAGVTVPLGVNLSKVWQQLQDVRKKQQDRLEESPDSDLGEVVQYWMFSQVQRYLLAVCSGSQGIVNFLFVQTLQHTRI